MKKVIACILLLALTVSLLAACCQKFISAEKAEKIALKELGIKAEDADGIHTHGAETPNGPAYSIHVEYEEQTHEFVILAATGEILSSGIVEGH